MTDNYIWPTHGILKGTIIPGQSGPESNKTEEELQIP